MENRLRKKWNVGGGLVHFEKIVSYLNEMKSYYDIRDPLISSVYDSHAGLRWNGGRYMLPFPFSMEESVRRIEYYNSIGVAFNITFSNTCINDDELGDEDCNWFLDKCHKRGNGVIVSSRRLMEFIRIHYPDYNLIASVGFCRRDIEFYLEMSEKFDVIVLHPDLNRHFDLLDKIDTSKIEVLVNELCMRNCPFREEHSRYISETIKSGRMYFKKDHEHLGSGCLASKRGFRKRSDLVLDLNEIEELLKRGVTRFKIQGREHPFEALILPALRNYVVKDTIRYLCRSANGEES